MLSNKIALVTGASSGIGKAIAKVMAREGAQVAVTDLHHHQDNQLLADLPDNKPHLQMLMDVTKHKQVIQVVQKIKQKLGKPPDIVVNSAGIILPKYMLNMSEETFDQVIEVNLKGTFIVNQVTAMAMKEFGIGGSIINISSIAGKACFAGHANYVSSKAGVIAFTKSSAKELGKFGIRVNCICPGFIQGTGMSNFAPSSQIMEAIKTKIPLGDFGYPEDVAETVAFLASSKAKYINGAAIDVHGGF